MLSICEKEITLEQTQLGSAITWFVLAGNFKKKASWDDAIVLHQMPYKFMWVSDNEFDVEMWVFCITEFGSAISWNGLAQYKQQYVSHKTTSYLDRCHNIHKRESNHAANFGTIL